MVHKSFMDKFIIQLRYHREDMGLSQCEMAEKLNIGLRSYQRYESAESIPSVDLLFKISQILDFNLRDFFAPEKYLVKFEGLKFYEENELENFAKDPLVAKSGVFAFFESKEFIKVVESDNIKLLRKSEFFQNSPFHLNVSNPKNRILNPTLHKLTEYNSDIIGATICFSDIKTHGGLWATLIDRKKACFEITTYPEFPAGKFIMKSKYMFRSFNYHYYLLGVSEPTKR